MLKTAKLIIPILLLLGIGSSFLREILVAYYYGSSRDVESFRIAFAIPYSLFQSLGTVLIGGLLPLYMQHSSMNFKVLSRQIYIFFGILFLLAVLSIPIQANLLAPGFNMEELNLLKHDMYLCWGVLIFSALIIPHRLFLQANDKTVLVSSTSLIFSLCFMIILSLLVAYSWPETSQLSIASLVSIMLVYLLFRLNVMSNEQLENSEECHKEIGHKSYKIMAGALIYVFLLAVPRLVDRAVASGYDEGVVANLDYAMNFYVAFGVLVGTSYVIIMTHGIAQSHLDNKNALWYGKLLFLPFFISSIITFFVIFNAEPLVDIAYNRGAFTEDSVEQTSEILFWFILSLPFMVTGMVVAQILIGANAIALVVIALIKICVKVLAIWLIGATGLDVFGLSALLMEISGVLIMICYIFWVRGLFTFSLFRS